ncbi:hypothetical protein MMC31_001890, partial [Peltigera leucophlebia]|nr:hypothetical protein [Peltigera leucophlebia]
MSDETSTTGTGSQAKREKLTGFVNWPLWTMLTRSMMIEKTFGTLFQKDLENLLQIPPYLEKRPKKIEWPSVLHSVFLQRVSVTKLPSKLWTSRIQRKCGTDFIALDTLHNDFDTTTASLLETGNKSFDEIFTIIQSKEEKFKSKLVTGNIGDAAMAF